MQVEAFQELVLNNLSEIKETQHIFNERLNNTCTTLTRVETTQTNFLQNHEKEFNQNQNKKFKYLGLILGLPTVIFQSLQYLEVI